LHIRTAVVPLPRLSTSLATVILVSGLLASSWEGSPAIAAKPKAKAKAERSSISSAPDPRTARKRPAQLRQVKPTAHATTLSEGLGMDAHAGMDPFAMAAEEEQAGAEEKSAQQAPKATKRKRRPPPARAPRPKKTKPAFDPLLEYRRVTREIARRNAEVPREVAAAKAGPPKRWVRPRTEAKAKARQSEPPVQVAAPAPVAKPAPAPARAQAAVQKEVRAGAPAPAQGAAVRPAPVAQANAPANKAAPDVVAWLGRAVTKVTRALAPVAAQVVKERERARAEAANAHRNPPPMYVAQRANARSWDGSLAEAHAAPAAATAPADQAQFAWRSPLLRSRRSGAFGHVSPGLDAAMREAAMKFKLMPVKDEYDAQVRQDTLSLMDQYRAGSIDRMGVATRLQGHMEGLHRHCRRGRGCFTADTTIATPSGPRAIETLRPGDEVLSVGPGGKGLVVDRVAEVHRAEAAEVLELRLSNGTTVQSTPGHRFVAADGRLIPVDALTLETRLWAQGSGALTPVDVRSLDASVSRPVYNLSLQRGNRYLANGQLVEAAAQDAE